MGFSDEDRILMGKWHIFKGYRAKNLARDLWIKAWDSRDWTKFLKTSCKKLARPQDEAAALKAHRISLVFYSVVFIHKLEERNTLLRSTFSQLQYYQILLKSSTSDRVIIQVKRVNFIETQCVVLEELLACSFLLLNIAGMHISNVTNLKRYRFSTAALEHLYANQYQYICITHNCLLLILCISE